MRYVLWLFFIVLCTVLQSTINNYLPIYLSPDILLMLVTCIAFFFNYYTALISIIIISYFASVFSAGSIWFYLFSYTLVFYVLVFVKRIFDRSRFIATATIATISTILYPFVVLLLSILSKHTILFETAIFTALKEIPANIICAYLLFKYLTLINLRLTHKNSLLQFRG